MKKNGWLTNLKNTLPRLSGLPSLNSKASYIPEWSIVQRKNIKILHIDVKHMEFEATTESPFQTK